MGPRPAIKYTYSNVELYNCYTCTCGLKIRFQTSSFKARILCRSYRRCFQLFRLLVGAPRAQTRQPGITRGGAVFRCPLDSEGYCQEIPFDLKGLTSYMISINKCVACFLSHIVIFTLHRLHGKMVLYFFLGSKKPNRKAEHYNLFQKGLLSLFILK